MPQLYEDKDLLQALINLQQTIEPIITKSASRDRDAVTDLKVRNSWDNSIIEIKQLLLYLQEFQELSDKDYNDFRSGVDTVLNLINQVIDNDILPASRGSDNADEIRTDPTIEGRRPMRRYRKFEVLLEMALGSKSPVDLSRLVHLPTSLEDSIQIEKGVTDFNKRNFERFKPAEQLDDNDERPADVTYTYNASPNLAESEFAKDMYKSAAKKSQADAESLLKILMNNIAKSKCAHKPHFIKLPVCDPQPHKGSHADFQHRFFTSSCEIENEWQETVCDVFAQSPRPQNNDLKSVNNICRTIKWSSENCLKLKVSVHQKRLYCDKSRLEPISNPPFRPTLSLEDVLVDDSIEFLPANKIVLGAILARALLRMYSGTMVVKELKSSNIYFLFDTSKSMTSEGYNPYFSYTLTFSEHQEDIPSKERDDLFQIKERNDSSNFESVRSPVLVSFGELLMEIALKAKMRPYRRRRDIELLGLICADETSEMYSSLVGKPYVEVIKSCLKPKFYDSESDSESEHSSDSKDSCKLNKKKKGKDSEMERCKGIMLNAVYELENLRKVFAPGISSTSKFAFSARKQSRATKDGDKAHQQELRGPVLDNSRFNDGSESPRVIWAKNFFKAANEFYENNISCILFSNENRIRVAVLDTGVNDKSSFWRGRKASRENRDFPIKKMEPFVGHLIDDEHGHGTNVTAIISKIAPEADFYIAKVSHGKENEGTTQIIDAIDWALRNDVHVVNMSFYLPSSDGNAKVRKKIQEAAIKGMIFVAAAANHGNNNARGFPAKLQEVICVYAVDGMGNKSLMNPPTKPGLNFGSLGVAVKSEWDADEVYLEGTSFATAVVTGMISNVLRLVKHAYDKEILAERFYREAFSSRGMTNILDAMAERTTDGHDYIRPNWKIWSKEDKMEDVVFKIREAMSKGMD